MAKDCCWICEGWQEITIQCSDTSSEPKFVHLGYQDYEAVYLKHLPALRMVPPGKKLYFFSVGDNQQFMRD